MSDTLIAGNKAVPFMIFFRFCSGLFLRVSSPPHEACYHCFVYVSMFHCWTGSDRRRRLGFNVFGVG